LKDKNKVGNDERGTTNVELKSTCIQFNVRRSALTVTFDPSAEGDSRREFVIPLKRKAPG
jgi:hypothetical protein